MKPRCKYRFVFFVCLLLLGEEFARAKPLNEDESGSGSSGDAKYNDDTYQTEDPDETYQSEDEDGPYQTNNEEEEDEDEDDEENGSTNWMNDEESGALPADIHHRYEEDEYPIDYGQGEEETDSSEPPPPPPPEPNDNDGTGFQKGEWFQDHVKAKQTIRPLTPQTPEDECAGKKGWVSGVFKVLKIGAKVINYGTTILSLGASVYKAIEGCSGTYPEAETYYNKFNDQKKVVEKISKEADDIQYEAQLDQTYIEDSADLFSRILCKLNEIDTDSETLLQTISPEVLIASMNASREITRLVEAKNKTKEKVDYLEVEGLFQGKLEIALSVGMSALALAIPAGMDIFKFSRKRYKERKMGFYEVNTGVDFEAPKTGIAAKLRETRFGQWIGRTQARFKTKIIDLKRKFNIRFSKIQKFAKRFKTGLGIGLNLAMAGYQLYETISSLTTQCKKVYDNIKGAYDQVMNATNTINAQMADIKEHRKAMDENWKLMRGNLTDDMFLQSVNTTMKVMQNSANKSEAMLNVARGINKFLTTIKSAEEQSVTYNESRDLYNVLLKVPFAFVCYTNKVKIINNVVSQCKDGVESMNKLIEQERTRFDTTVESMKPGDPRYCKDSMGIDYLPDHSIIQAWDKTAELKGYQKVCFLNNKGIANYICKRYKELKKTAEQIASDSEKDLVGVKEAIKAMPEGPSNSQKNIICNMKTAGTADDMIVNIMTNMVREEYKAGLKDLVATIDCNVKYGFDCLPPTFFPPPEPAPQPAPEPAEKDSEED